MSGARHNTTYWACVYVWVWEKQWVFLFEVNTCGRGRTANRPVILLQRRLIAPLVCGNKKCSTVMFMCLSARYSCSERDRSELTGWRWEVGEEPSCCHVAACRLDCVARYNLDCGRKTCFEGSTTICLWMCIVWECKTTQEDIHELNCMCAVCLMT